MAAPDGKQTRKAGEKGEKHREKANKPTASIDLDGCHGVASANPERVSLKVKFLVPSVIHRPPRKDVLFFSFLQPHPWHVDVPRLGGASEHHSHSNVGSTLHLRPMLRFMATPDP